MIKVLSRVDKVSEWCVVVEIKFDKNKGLYIVTGWMLVGDSAIHMMITVFWNVMIHSLVDLDHCFGGTCYHHIQDRQISEVWKKGYRYRECRKGVLMKPVVQISLHNYLNVSSRNH